jgi:hypothetical protein
MNARDEYVAGLRALANWLEQSPLAPVPEYQERLLVPLTTNRAVEEAAADLGLDAELDSDGNASIEFTFGPITYHIYGYADYGQFSDALDERQARGWAEKNDMEIVPAAEDGAR